MSKTASKTAYVASLLGSIVLSAGGCSSAHQNRATDGGADDLAVTDSALPDDSFAPGDSGSSDGGPTGIILGPPVDAGPVTTSGHMGIFTVGLGSKIQATTKPPTTTAQGLSLAGPRDSWAAGQLVVYGNGGNLAVVTIATAADLSDGAGHTIAASNVTLFREQFINFSGVKANTGNVPVPSNSPTGDAQLPDPLIPFVDAYTGINLGQPFAVLSASNQPVWVDVHVPKGTAAGVYRTTLHVATNTPSDAADIPLAVEVWPIDLPDMRSVTTHFQIDVNQLVLYHAGIYDCPKTGACYLNENAQCLQIVQRYEEMAHDHRVDPGQVFEGTPGSDCTVPTDWTSYDARMTPYMSGSYWSDGVPSSRMDPPFSPGETYGLDACAQSQYTALSTAWAQHLKSKGWFDRAIVYAYDEPPTTAYAAIAKGSSWLQAGDPDWKAHVMDTTSPNATNIATLGPAIGIFTVNLPWYDNWSLNKEYGRADWPALMAKGTQLWFYESDSVLPPYPTFASNTLDGLEPVMAMWGSWYEGATGFLYWDMAAWNTTQPWGPNIDYGLTGDGVLLYAGNHNGTAAPTGSPTTIATDGPIPSYRLKAVRTGLQDWALFKLADQKGLTSQVRTQVAQVYGQFGNCTYSGCPAPAAGFLWKTDEAAMNQIRRAVAQAILSAP